VVGLAGLGGVHSQLRVTRDLLELGVPGERIVPVVNRAPRNPRLRAEAGMTFARLLTATNPGVMLASSLLYLPERRRVAELLRDNAGPPAQLVRPLAGAVRGLLEAAPPLAGVPGAGPEPVPVAPGSLGSWYDDCDEAAEA